MTARRSPRRALPARLATDLLALALALGLALATGCAKSDAGAQRCVGDDAAAIDTDLMAFLSAARARHHEANLREDGDDLPGAIAAMEKLLALRRPHQGAKVPEVDEVMADAHARLADLRLRARDVAGAAREVAEGLKHAPDTTYFRGHLLEIDGIVEETRAADLADAGRKTEAAEARARAVRVLQEAVSIQEKVIQRSLDGRDAGDGGGP